MNTEFFIPGTFLEQILHDLLQISMNFDGVPIVFIGKDYSRTFFFFGDGGMTKGEAIRRMEYAGVSQKSGQL